MKKRTIKVGLVDDHALFRRGIAALLKEFDDLDILFEAGNGKELQLLLPRHPDVDVILMDIKMPGLDGYAATAWVKKQLPHISVLALSMFDEANDIIKMLKAGAGGYLLKESSSLELYKAIKGIKENGFYSNELISGKIIQSMHVNDGSGTSGQPFSITPKELEFLKLCATELTYKEIAEVIGVAPRSVDNYRQSLFQKLEIKSRVGLVLFGIKKKLIDID